MNLPIQTNQLEVELNAAALAERFHVFRIETTEKYFDRGAYILDAPQLCNQVCAVFFERGNCFYVLMRKEPGNKRRLRELLVHAEGGDSITLAELKPADVEARVMISLLLYALGSYEPEFLRFNNLTGHLYCYHPSWLKGGGQRTDNVILKVPCLELSITAELRLDVRVHTFTSERLRHRIVFTSKQFEQYPKYVFGANHHTLRRKLSSDGKAECFIQRQTQGDRTEIPFLDIASYEKFRASKMGLVAEVMALFNKRYAGLCNLRFQRVEDYMVVDSPKALVKENTVAVRNLLNEQRVRIVDLVGDGESDRLCRDVKGLLKEKYGVTAAIGKRKTRNCLNLCVIHDAKFYEGKEDPHTDGNEGLTVQHITLENFAGNAAGAIMTVVQELLIKNDIRNRRFSLYNWGKSGVEEEISFGVSREDGGDRRYFFMRICPDGTFSFEEKGPALTDHPEYTECVNAFRDNRDLRDVQGVVRYANGEVNVIRETSWYTVPEIGKIHSELAAGNTYLRGKERRRELLPSITDIKLFQQGGKMCYFVGIIGEGMRTTVNHAAIIRTIEPYEGAALHFDELLPLMNVPFVRNGRLTVIPFPFKYLREYVKTALGEEKRSQNPK